ncbi:hypothetical protein LJR231_005843 [Phyllobacterium sp. LjRoot231]|uniref:hypothetical protein n=1 Tax=Phyllobacterium sp. LjRoot231 TaxID=3342289 RepID=UPI003ECCD4D5
MAGWAASLEANGISNTRMETCDDELALQWSGEHFLWGEYISIRGGGTIRTYRITLVERP